MLLSHLEARQQRTLIGMPRKSMVVPEAPLSLNSNVYSSCFATAIKSRLTTTLSTSVKPYSVVTGHLLMMPLSPLGPSVLNVDKLEGDL